MKAIYLLPNDYQDGKLVAYKTICKIVTSLYKSHDIDNPILKNSVFIDVFYMTIHKGLRSCDKVIF